MSTQENDETSKNIKSAELASLFFGTSDGALPTTESTAGSFSTLLKKHSNAQQASKRGVGGVSGGGGGGINDEALQQGRHDVSGMDAAQASILLKNKYGKGKSVEVTQSRRVQGRHRRGDRVKRNYDGIVPQVADQTERAEGESSEDGHDKDEDEFRIASKQRLKAKAKAASKSGKIDLQLDRDSNVKTDRLKRGKSEASSDDDSSDSDSSIARRRRHRRQRQSRRHESSSDSDSGPRRLQRRRRARSRSSSDNSSSSSSEDEQSKRRNRARAKRMERQKRESIVAPKDKDKLQPKDSVKDVIVPPTTSSPKKPHTSIIAPAKRRARSPPPSSSSSSSSSSGSDSDSSSSSSSSSSEESTSNAIAKPIFVPKHKRQRINQIQEEANVKRDLAKEQTVEKRIQQSRALVAQVVTNETNERNQAMDGSLGDQNEFDESGGSVMPPPSDVDPESNQKEAMEVREAWEVRELMRVWRDLKEFVTVRTEEMERERRRKMTDEERYREDVEEGVYRRPGEQRRNGDGAAHSYHHRGAFYMDEDTLEKAGKDDIRHKAAEYARAATGEDTFNRKAMPKVLQVKKFGYAGYSTKYKGLAKEDTTDKSAIYMSKRKDQRNHESNKSSSRRR